MNISLDQSLKPQPQPGLQELLSNHKAFVGLVQRQEWISADKEKFGTNLMGHSLYDYERMDYVGIFAREFEATLHLPPDLTNGVTMIPIARRIDELVVDKSYVKLFTALLVDLHEYQQQTQSIVTAEQLMISMDVALNPRLCDLKLDDRDVPVHIVRSEARPMSVAAGSQEYSGLDDSPLRYRIIAREIRFAKNPLDREIRASDTSINEFRRLSGPGVPNSPDRLY